MQSSTLGGSAVTTKVDSAINAVPINPVIKAAAVGEEVFDFSRDSSCSRQLSKFL